MGLILDTTILIAGERRGETVEDILHQARSMHGEVDIALSAVSVVELTHGIYRARTEADRLRRRAYAEGALHDLIVYPVSLEIAQLAGQIEGEQAAQGNIISFEDSSSVRPPSISASPWPRLTCGTFSASLASKPSSSEWEWFFSP